MLLVFCALLNIGTAVNGQSSLCSNCANRFGSFELCQKSDRKTVDRSGVCNLFSCREDHSVFCGHQVSAMDESCFLWDLNDEKNRKKQASTIKCEKGICACKNQNSIQNMSLHEMIEFANLEFYPFKCGACSKTKNIPILDISIENKWQDIGLIMQWSDRRSAMQYQLNASMRHTALERGYLQYDCPVEDAGGLQTVHVCTRHGMLAYATRVAPFHALDTEYMHRWQPSMVTYSNYMHNIVFIVQRPPIDLLCSEKQWRFKIHGELVKCGNSTCQSYLETGYKLSHWVKCVDIDQTNLKFIFDLPWLNGFYSLKLEVGNSPDIYLSVPYEYIAHWWILPFYILLLFIAIVIIAVICVCRKKMITPKFFNALFIYNSDPELVARLTNCLRRYCYINGTLDILDIPRSCVQDPIDWIVTNIDRHKRIILLWMPENRAPPTYKLFTMAIKHLNAMNTQKSVYVVTHAESSPLPSDMSNFKQIKLPFNFTELLCACGHSRHQSRQLVDKLLNSADGMKLVASFSQNPAPNGNLKISDTLKVPSGDRNPGRNSALSYANRNGAKFMDGKISPQLVTVMPIKKTENTSKYPPSDGQISRSSSMTTFGERESYDDLSDKSTSENEREEK